MPDIAAPRKRAEHRLANDKEAKADLKAMAQNVRQKRAALGLTLEEAAGQIGCSWQQLHHIEKADNFPSWSLYRALVRFFKAGRLPLV